MKEECGKYCYSSRFCVFSLAIAFGITTGLWLLLFAWFANFWGHGAAIITQWSEVYKGYAPSIAGGFIGFAWGFVEGFIFGLLLGWIYNCCSRCCKCCKGICKSRESGGVEVKKD